MLLKTSESFQSMSINYKKNNNSKEILPNILILITIWYNKSRMKFSTDYVCKILLSIGFKTYRFTNLLQT